MCVCVCASARACITAKGVLMSWTTGKLQSGIETAADITSNEPSDWPLWERDITPARAMKTWTTGRMQSGIETAADITNKQTVVSKHAIIKSHEDGSNVCR